MLKRPLNLLRRPTSRSFFQTGRVTRPGQDSPKTPHAARPRAVRPDRRGNRASTVQPQPDRLRKLLLAGGLRLPGHAHPEQVLGRLSRTQVLRGDLGRRPARECGPGKGPGSVRTGPRSLGRERAVLLRLCCEHGGLQLGPRPWGRRPGNAPEGRRPHFPRSQVRQPGAVPLGQVLSMGALRSGLGGLARLRPHGPGSPSWDKAYS